MSAAAAPDAAAGTEASAEDVAPDDESYYDSEDDETWEERAWRHLITKASFSEWTYPRTRAPYRKYAPQIPFFMHLGGSNGRRLRLYVPQTVVFGLRSDPGSDGLQQAWLMNTRDGYVHRREKFDPDADVVPAFASDDPEEIVAVFKRRVNGSAQRQLLTTDDLREIVYNRQSYGLFAIQAFVPPRKGRATLSRCVWKRERGGGGYTHFVYAVSNKTSSADTANRDDMLLDLSVYNCATVNKLRGVAVEDLEEMTDSVAQYIQKGLGMLVQDLVCDFVKDDRGTWWLLQVKAFRLASHRGKGANRRIKEFLERDSAGGTLPDYSHIVTDGSSLLKSKSMTTLHLRGQNRDTAESPLDWDGGEADAKEFRRLLEAGFFKEAQKALGKAPSEGHLVRKTPEYNRAPPPTLPGKPLTMLDEEAQSACRWCGTRCRTSHLQCTMSLKMIGDVQRHLQQRGVSFSWFDRMDITLRSSSQAALSGSTSTLMSQQSVCHSCYEIYVTEQKLMRAERLFAQQIGVPVPSSGKSKGGGGGGSGLGVKHLAIDKTSQGEKLSAEEPQEIPSNLQCYRMLTMFGDLEQLPVPLLFGVTGLSLQYTFMGVTTTMQLDVDGATLSSARVPGATPKDEPPQAVTDLVGPPGAAAAEAAGSGSGGGGGGGGGGDGDASEGGDAAAAGAEGGGSGSGPGQNGKEGGADGATTSSSSQLEPEPEPEPEEGAGSGRPQTAAEKQAAEEEEEQRNRYGEVKGKEKDVRVKRSLFSGQAEKLRREKEEREEAARKKKAWEEEMEAKQSAELAARRAEEKRKAEEAIRKAEEARLKREAEEAARKAALDSLAREQARLDAERARLAAEPTFNQASVPVNKLRPFYFFVAAPGHQVIKSFFMLEEKIELHLCSHGRRLSTAHIPLSHFYASLHERKEFIVHFHTEGLSDTFIKMALGLTRVDNMTKEVSKHFPLGHERSVEHMKHGVWLPKELDFSPCQPLPHAWIAQLNDARQTRGRVPAEERRLTHQIAKEELITKQNAEIALYDLLGSQQQEQKEEEQLLLEDGNASGTAADAAAVAKAGPEPPPPGAGERERPRSIMEQYAGAGAGREREPHSFQTRSQFTHISDSNQSLAAMAEKDAEAAYRKMQKADRQADQPAYWRCVVEMLHIAGLGPRKRGSMYAANGAQVAIEFRLFGQTLRTGFVGASPPITLMDSHHQMHIRARQSALRRYFFASPRIFVAVMYSHADAVDRSRAAISRRAAEMAGRGGGGGGGGGESSSSSDESSGDEGGGSEGGGAPAGEDGERASALLCSAAQAFPHAHADHTTRSHTQITQPTKSIRHKYCC
jgi:hypothetical protein